MSKWVTSLINFVTFQAVRAQSSISAPRFDRTPGFVNRKNRWSQNQGRQGALQASYKITLFRQGGKVFAHQLGFSSVLWITYWSFKVMSPGHFRRAYCAYRIHKWTLGSLWWDIPLRYQGSHRNYQHYQWKSGSRIRATLHRPNRITNSRSQEQCSP